MRRAVDCLAMVPLLLPGVAGNACCYLALPAMLPLPLPPPLLPLPPPLLPLPPPLLPPCRALVHPGQQARWGCQCHRFPVALVAGCAVSPTIFAGHPAGCFKLGAFYTQLLLLYTSKRAARLQPQAALQRARPAGWRTRRRRRPPRSELLSSGPPRSATTSSRRRHLQRSCYF